MNQAGSIEVKSYQRQVAVSYTHLDVYKRQMMKYMREIREIALEMIAIFISGSISLLLVL